MITMMHTFSQRFQAYFGWCPATSRPAGIPAPVTEASTGTCTGHNQPKPGTVPAHHASAAWMTAGAVAILLATCFVGGNIWWPPVVLAVLVIFILIHLREIKSTGGA